MNIWGKGRWKRIKSTFSIAARWEVLSKTKKSRNSILRVFYIYIYYVFYIYIYVWSAYTGKTPERIGVVTSGMWK